MDETKINLQNLSQHCWYADDGILAGAETELFQALKMLTESGDKCRLELRKEKFVFWSMESMTKVFSFIKRNRVDGIEILGAPVGSDAFDSYCLQKRVKK